MLQSEGNEAEHVGVDICASELALLLSCKGWGNQAEVDDCKRQDQKEDIKISKSLALARMLYKPSFVGARRVDFLFVQQYATMHYTYPTVRLVV